MIVSNFPFWLQGWNSSDYVPEHVDESVSETRVRYVLKPYTLYFIFDIVGLYIEMRNGIWGMRRACDDRPFITKVPDNDDTCPFGIYMSPRHDAVYFREY